MSRHFCKPPSSLRLCSPPTAHSVELLLQSFSNLPCLPLVTTQKYLSYLLEELHFIPAGVLAHLSLTLKDSFVSLLRHPSVPVILMTTDLLAQLIPLLDSSLQFSLKFHLLPAWILLCGDPDPLVTRHALSRFVAVYVTSLQDQAYGDSYLHQYQSSSSGKSLSARHIVRQIQPFVHFRNSDDPSEEADALRLAACRITVSAIQQDPLWQPKLCNDSMEEFWWLERVTCRLVEELTSKAELAQWTWVAAWSQVLADLSCLHSDLATATWNQLSPDIQETLAIQDDEGVLAHLFCEQQEQVTLKVVTTTTFSPNTCSSNWVLSQRRNSAQSDLSIPSIAEDLSDLSDLEEEELVEVLSSSSLSTPFNHADRVDDHVDDRVDSNKLPPNHNLLLPEPPKSLKSHELPPMQPLKPMKNTQNMPKEKWDLRRWCTDRALRRHVQLDKQGDFILNNYQLQQEAEFEELF